MKAIIIDDEQKNRDLLRNYLAKYCPEVELLGEAENVRTGEELVLDKKPDLLFLDVEMPDGTGFDLLEKVKNKLSFNVIFVTAFENYALKAFRYSAIDYLQKPIDPEQLAQAVNRAKKEMQLSDISNKLKVLIHNQDKVEKLALPSSDGIRMIKIQDIIRCQSDSNYTHIYLSDGEKITVTRTLKEYADMLQDEGFHRIHHSHLINIGYVNQYVNRDGGYVIMSDKSVVEIARRKKDEFLAALLNK